MRTAIRIVCDVGTLGSGLGMDKWKVPGGNRYDTRTVGNCMMGRVCTGTCGSPAERGMES